MRGAENFDCSARTSSEATGFGIPSPAGFGVGKAVLATYSDEDVSAIISHHGMPRMTEKSIVRPSELFRELEKVRRQGFAIDDEEACMGLRCIAAVVYNDCSEPLAAISVSGMTSRITDDRLLTLGETVREVAAELTLALGGVMPEGKSGRTEWIFWMSEPT